MEKAYKKSQILDLTPAQRKEVYQQAIASIKQRLKWGKVKMGLCWTLTHAVVDLKYRTESDKSTGYGLDMKRNFPEVYKFKPIKRKWHNDHFWFACDEAGMQARIDILEKAIIITDSL
jgi:hypothetical protein